MTEPIVKHIANLQISSDLFRTIFHLPDDTHILAASVDHLHYGVLIITIENEELPAVEEGRLIPIAIPKYRTIYGDNGNVLAIYREDWGIR